MRKKNRLFLEKILEEIKLLQIIKTEFFNVKLNDLEQTIKTFLLNNSRNKKLEFYKKFRKIIGSKNNET